MGFRDFLKSIKDEDSPSGDFASDALRDGNFPWRKAKGKGGKVAIFDYLYLEANACSAAVMAFGTVWKRYLREGSNANRA